MKHVLELKHCPGYKFSRAHGNYTQAGGRGAGRHNEKVLSAAAFSLCCSAARLFSSAQSHKF